MIGKKAKCKKCGTSFRIPGPLADSVGESQMLSAIGDLPVPKLPDDDDDVPMAGAVEDFDSPAAPTPPPNVAALPSADAFDFTARPAVKPAAKSPATPAPTAPVAPTRPAFGAAKAAPPPPPTAKPAVVPATQPKPAASSPPQPTKKAPEPEVLSLDDEEPLPPPAPKKAAPVAPVAPVATVLEPTTAAATSDDPFSFDLASAPASTKDEPKAKNKKRSREEDDEDERDRKKRKEKEKEKDKDKGKEKAQDKDKKRARDEDEEEEPNFGASAPTEEAGVAADNPLSFDYDAPTTSPSTKNEPQAKGRKRPRDDDDDNERDRKKEKAKDKDKDKDTDKKRARDDDGDEPEEGEGRRYVRPGEQKASKKMMLIALLMGTLAIGAVVAAVVVSRNQAKEVEKAKKDEQAKKDAEQAQKDEQARKDAEQAKIDAIPKDPPKKDKEPKDPPKKDKEPKDPPKKDKEPKDPVVVPPPKKDKEPKDPVVPPKKEDRTFLMLDPKLKPFQLRPATPKPELIQRPTPGQPLLQVDVPIDKVKRFYGTKNRVAQDPVVVWVANPGVNTKGEKIAVDTYSGTTGAKVNRFDYDGDGFGVKCDVSPDGKRFVAAGVDGKITVWNLADKTKTLDGVDPYADKPDHKKAGVGAVFFAGKGERLFVVSTAGAVHLFDIATNKTLDSVFVPVGSLVAGRVMQGKSVAADDGRSSLVLAVNGAVYQVAGDTTLSVSQKIDLKGEVGRSLGIGVFGNPGRIVYAFETEEKKEKALLVALKADKFDVIRWQDAAGEPSAIAWAGGDLAIVSTTRGALWIDYGDENKRLQPLALADVPGGKAVHAATESAHWYLVADPANPARSLGVEITTPFEGLLAFRAAAEAKMPSLHTVRLDDKGLSK